MTFFALNVFHCTPLKAISKSFQRTEFFPCVGIYQAIFYAIDSFGHYKIMHKIFFYF